MKKKVMFISPYRGLVNIINSIEMPAELDVSVEVGNLNEGVELAIEAEKKGYDLIISRGGTASQIEEIVSIPVIHIEITGYDILRIIAMITGVDTKVALVGFPNISEGAATICSILEYDVNLITINSQTEVEEVLYHLKNEDYSVVIGDVVTVKHAKEAGLQGVLLTSGREAVFDSLKVGLRMFELLENNQKNYEITQNLFDSMPLPTAVLNNNKHIIYHNKSFLEKVVQSGIASKNQFYEFLNNIDENEEKFYFDEENLINFTLKTFSIENSKDLQGIVIKRFRYEESHTFIHKKEILENPNIIGNSDSAIKIKKLIDFYSKNEGIISIIGEKGTGKKTVAKAIHFRKFGSEHPIYFIDLIKISEDMIDYIKYSFKRILQGSIILENTEKISPIFLNELLKNVNKKVQLFILFNSMNHLENTDSIASNHLEYIKDARSIHLPPLRNRTDDLKYFVNYYLSNLNAEKGLEILGIKKEALEILQQCFWSGNIPQLKLLINEISLFVQNHYIELNDVEFLKNPRTTGTNDEITVKIDNLKNIEKQIIEEVMEREKGNQSKTAKVLGINRSTLWRKLNE